MSDGRKNNGGAREGAGRKPKADEIAKVELMDSIGDPKEAWEKLWDKVKDNDLNAIRFWIEQRYGKAKQSTDVTSGGEEIADPFPYHLLPKGLALQIAELLHAAEQDTGDRV